jgi:glycosyltransferase involved in cell wall biosynthesis
MQPVIVDLTPLVTPSALRGIGRYVRGLVQGLSELDADIRSSLLGCAASPDLTRLEPITDMVEYCSRPAAAPVRLARSKRSWLICHGAPAFVAQHPGLLHLTDPKGVPWSSRSAYSLTCHDLIPIVLHEQYLPKIPGWDRLYAGVERFRYRRAQRILAVSHATKRDLCSELGIDEARVDVVWHGVDHARFNTDQGPAELASLRPILGDSAPYVLYLGAGDARKDLGTLISAYASSRVRREARLLIAGHLSARQSEKLRLQIQALGVERDVVLSGYVDEQLVPALYRNAAVHVFASRYEGFGLPVLEALACGAPTITSPGSSLDEVAGDAALIVPVAEPDALREALEILFFDEARRDELRARGLRRAQSFTWRACAEKTVQFWKRAASG